MAIVSTGVPTGAIASIFGNEFNYVDLREGLAGLPQVIGIFATYDPLKTSVIPNEPIQVFSEVEVGDKLGFGFPAHLAARQTLRKSGIVPVFIFPIEEAVAAVAADGNILFTGTTTSSGTLSIYIAGQEIKVTIPSGTLPADTVTLIIAAIAANTTDLPVTSLVNATPEQIDITSKYLGLIANDITLAINLTEDEKDKAPAGLSWVITDMASGAGEPTVTDALENFGVNWYTWVVNTFGSSTDVMDEFDTFNEDERWNSLVNKFFRAFYGSVDNFATVTAITDARKLDRTNGVIPSPSAYALPLELAALAVGQMAARNQNNPAKPYKGLVLDGLLPGPDSDQWSYTVANSAENLGSSWTELRDGKITLNDVIMHYHRTGENPPAYRYAVDIAKLAEWHFNAALQFKAPEWESAILVKNDDIVSNPDARRPRDAVAVIHKLADGANDAALITKKAFTKANTAASIDIANPNRINITTIIVLSGSSRIISLTTNFGFNFGSLAT